MVRCSIQFNEVRRIGLRERGPPTYVIHVNLVLALQEKLHF